MIPIESRPHVITGSMYRGTCDCCEYKTKWRYFVGHAERDLREHWKAKHK